VSTDPGSETTGGSSSDVFVVNVVTDETPTTDTSLVAGGAVTGSDLGCVAAVVSTAGSLLLVSLSAGAGVTFFFGPFGVTAASEASEPDFLSLTAWVDFLLVSLLPASSVSSASVALSPLASAPSSADDPEVWEDSDVLDDEDVSVDESEDDFEDDFDEDDESDDELEEPESDGPAHATPGVVATATPTPNATARPPTRPTYLA